jgi:hypothetical protein
MAREVNQQPKRDLGIEVSWQFVAQRHPLWDKLWKRILAPQERSGHPNPEDVEYESGKKG